MVALSAREALEAAGAAITPEKALLDSLREINLRFLLALMDAAHSGDYENRTDLGAASSAFKALNPESAARASRFPFLMMDLGLSEADAACSLHSVLQKQSTVRDRGLLTNTAWHHRSAIARTALMLAWHSVRVDVGTALILFGLSPRNATELSLLALHEIEPLASYCATPLRVRWHQSRYLWQQLLTPTSHTSLENVRAFVMHVFRLSAMSRIDRHLQRSSE